MIDTLQSFMDASPFIQECGMRVVEADKDKQFLKIDMPLTSRLERAAGSKQFHGGAIASLIDTAGTFALVMLAGKAVPTINFRTDFLRPAIDTTLRAEAQVRKVGRTVGVVDIDVTDQDGRLLAVGRGTFGT